MCVCVCVCVCVCTYSSTTLHSFRKQSFLVSAVKAKLPELCFSVCLSQRPVVINRFKTRQSIL